MGQIGCYSLVILGDVIYSVKLPKMHSIIWQGEGWHLIIEHVPNFGQDLSSILGDSIRFLPAIYSSKIK